MKEILSIQIGQCGNQIGQKFFEQIISEHSLNPFIPNSTPSPLHLSKISSYFTQSSINKYTPRIILADLDPFSLDQILSKPFGQLLSSDSFIYGHLGHGVNWARGYYSEGADLAESILEAVRKQAESYTNLQGFQILHSLGGGTGSGVGSSLIYKLKEEYTKQVLSCFSIFPSYDSVNASCEAINSVLAMNELIENSDIVTVFDNEALKDICANKFRFNHIENRDLNHIICRALSSFTCSMRFSGEDLFDLPKLAANLVPFHRLHFLSVAHAPLTSEGYQQFTGITVNQLLCELNGKHGLSFLGSDTGKYLAAAIVYRGLISNREVEGDRDYFCESDCVDMMPDKFKSFICEAGFEEPNKSAILIANSTGVQKMFKEVIERFKVSLKRKESLFKYFSEGMDETEFFEAESNFSHLITEYQNI